MQQKIKENFEDDGPIDEDSLACQMELVQVEENVRGGDEVR